MERENFTWSAPEYYHYERTSLWYWTSLFVTIVLVAFALLRRNFLFAVFLVIAEVLVVNWGRKTPDTITFNLTIDGIHLDKKKFYSYADLLGFTMIKPERDDKFMELVLHTKQRINTHVKVIVPKEEQMGVYEYINQFLEELEYEESALEHLSHMLKF